MYSCTAISQQLGGSPAARLTNWLPTQRFFGRQAVQHAPMEALSGSEGEKVFRVFLPSPRMHWGVGAWQVGEGEVAAPVRSSSSSSSRGEKRREAI